MISSNIMSINKISGSSSSMDNNRNLLKFNQINSFHLKAHSIDQTEESLLNSDKNSTTSINSVNPIQTSSSSFHEGFTLHKSPVHSSKHTDKSSHSNQFIPNPRISLSQIITSIPINPSSTLSQDLKSSSFKLLRSNENIQSDLLTPHEISPRIKIRHDIKPEFESLWKTKLSLKTLISMANRDDAQALKNRKPIDYHMFLTNKFTKNSILQYNDLIDTKFQMNNKQTNLKQFTEEENQENRNLYKRLLKTMALRKSINIKKIEMPIKQIKTKRRIKILPKNESLNEIEKPVLIIYQAIPI